MCKWVLHFKIDEMIVGKPRSGCPETSKIDTNVRKVQALLKYILKYDNGLFIGLLYILFGISYGLVQPVLTKYLVMKFFNCGKDHSKIPEGSS